jgi:hypothetical protein
MASSFLGPPIKLLLTHVTALQQIHARLGELLYVCSSSSEGNPARLAGKSVQHFCRSIELCDDYLRGFYGLVLVSSLLWGLIASCGAVH